MLEQVQAVDEAVSPGQPHLGVGAPGSTEHAVGRGEEAPRPDGRSRLAILAVRGAVRGRGLASARDAGGGVIVRPTTPRARPQRTREHRVRPPDTADSKRAARPSPGRAREPSELLSSYAADAGCLRRTARGRILPSSSPTTCGRSNEAVLQGGFSLLWPAPSPTPRTPSGACRAGALGRSGTPSEAGSTFGDPSCPLARPARPHRRSLAAR